LEHELEMNLDFQAACEDPALRQGTCQLANPTAKELAIAAAQKKPTVRMFSA